MKRMRKWIIWVALSLVLQLVFLTYLNEVFLPSKRAVTFSIWDEFETIQAKQFTIPAKAEKLSVSFDGNYAAYVLAQEMVIIETQKSTVVETLLKEHQGVPYFRWLPDRNILIFGVAYEAGAVSVKLATYDVASHWTREYPAINQLPNGSRITDIRLSPITNTVYVKVSTNAQKAQIYRYDIMDHCQLVLHTSPKIRMEQLLYEDVLIYQDEKNRINIFYENKEERLPFDTSMVLLGLGAEDRLYIGELQGEGLLQKIYYGTRIDLGQGMGESILLNKACRYEDVMVNRQGIFWVDRSAGKLFNVFKAKEQSFRGSLVEINEYFLVTRDQGAISIQPI